MADTFTTLLRLIKQETGGNENVWGDFLNLQMIDLIDDAVAGFQDVDVTLSNQILLPLNGDDDPTRAAILVASGLPPDGTRTIQVPSTSKLYVLANETSEQVTFKTAAGSGLIVFPGETVSSRVDPNLDDVVPVNDPPQATEDRQGVAEIATQVEVDTGTDDERFVTPLKLTAFPAVNQATEDIAGVAEIADQAETDAGTDDERFITPLKYENSSQIAQATDTDLGRARIATQSEVDTGTEAEAYVTPATLSSTPVTGGTIFQGFVPSTGIGEVVPAGWSAVRNGIGQYTVTHNLGLSDVNDLIIQLTPLGEPVFPFGPVTNQFITITGHSRTANTFQVLTGFPDMGTIGGAEHEDQDFYFTCFDIS